MQSEYFDESKKEYVIAAKENTRSWNNYLGNFEYGMVINNKGLGYNYYSGSENPINNNLANVSLKKQPKIILIKDKLTNKIWSTVSRDLDEPVNKFECRHGSGYTIIKSVCNETVFQTIYFVPTGEKFEIWHLKLSNTCIKKRSISLCTFGDSQNDLFEVYFDDNSDNSLYTFREETVMKEASCLFFFNNETLAYESNLDSFIRDNFANEKTNKKRIGNKTNNKCSVLQIDTELEPLEIKDFIVFMGSINLENDRKKIIEKFGNLEAVEKEFNRIVNNKTCVTNAIRIF